MPAGGCSTGAARCRGFASPSCHGDFCRVPAVARSLPTAPAGALVLLAAAGAIVSCSLIGTRGFEPGQFFRPAHLAVDAAGFLYVADTDNHRVQVIGADGAFVDAIEVGYVGMGKRAIVGPLAWASGVLYAADAFNHVVLRMDLRARQAR